MGLKITIIGFFLLLFTFMLILWINSIQVGKHIKPSDTPTPVYQVVPAQSPSDSAEPAGFGNVQGISTSSSEMKPKVCINKCGDNLCQIVACKGSNCPCSENPVSCPNDCQ